MSFVVFTGCHLFGAMYGDKRSTSDNAETVSENVQKVKRINNNVITCAGGHSALINVLWKPIFYSPALPTLTYKQTVELISKKYLNISDELKELSKEHSDLTANIGVCGRSNGYIKFTLIEVGKSINVKETIHKTENDDVTMCFLAQGQLHLGNIYKNLFYKTPVFSSENLKSIFYQTLKKGIKLGDSSINDNFDCEVIYLHDLSNELKENNVLWGKVNTAEFWNPDKNKIIFKERTDSDNGVIK
ncbi:hypothetical protein [Robinsoniella peoriensis]|uniref:hypothetical protein n=1 Tax=Robinsoniella peoriensis TaxID=180332 RepID=UPI0005C7C7FC|nr:hypothetical protein [Robinsoniella peoriensis]